MADEVTLKWNYKALPDLRYGDTDPRVRYMLENMAVSIADQCNAELGEKGYFISSKPGRRNPYGRWQVRVYAGTTHAKRSDAVHNTLRRMLGVADGGS